MRLSPGRRVSLAPVTGRSPGGLECGVRGSRRLARYRKRVVRGRELVLRVPQPRGELVVLCGECRAPLRDVGQLALSALTLKFDPANPIAHLPHLLIRTLERVTRVGHLLARRLLDRHAERQGVHRRSQRLFRLRLFSSRELPFRHDARAEGVTVAELLFRPPAARECVLVSFFCHADLALQLQHRLAGVSREPRALMPHGFSGRPGSVCRVTRGAGGAYAFLCLGRTRAQPGQSCIELRELVLPCRHLSRRQRQFHRESPGRDLRVALGALALTGERTYLAGDFIQQIIETREVPGGLFEAPLGGAPPVAIESHARRFLKELTTVVGTVRQECIDHSALDHDTAVGAESSTANKIVNVPQPAWGAVQEVLTLACPGQTTGDDNLPERNRQLTIGVFEVE